MIRTTLTTIAREAVSTALILSFLVGCALVACVSNAEAAPIEGADRIVDRPVLTYAEAVGTARHPHRVYFELNDGSTYRYINYRICVQSADVFAMICVRAFAEARR